MLKELEFGRAETKAIKGVAVLLMLFHHIAGFPARLPIDFSGFESYITALVEHGYIFNFAVSAKICVSLFFFLGGYGFYIRRKSSKVSVISEIVRLYCAYWKVFIIFIPIGILFFAKGTDVLNEYCVRFLFESKSDMVTAVLSDFIGYTYGLNDEWWFFKSYLCAMILGRLFCELTDKNNSFWKDLFAVFVVDILIRTLFPALTKTEALSPLGTNLFYREFFTINKFSTAYFAGIVFAKYDGINWLIKKIQTIPYPTIVSAVGFCMMYWARTYIISETGDILYCALMIPMLCIIFNKLKAVKRVFVYLGKHSTNIWLLHSFYCYYFLGVTRLVFITKSVFVDLLILVLISLASSIALEQFYGLLKKLCKKVCPMVAK